MAIFGSFPTVRKQVAADPRFNAACAYVAEVLKKNSPSSQRVAALAVGASERIELSGGAFALEQAYQPKAREDGFFESHRKYIDVQVIVSGNELMEVDEISRLGVTDAYQPERDFIKYGITYEASVLRMRAGDAAIFFPEDGHMPSLRWEGKEPVRKVVVKVPVA